MTTMATKTTVTATMAKMTTTTTRLDSKNINRTRRWPTAQLYEQ